MSSPSNRFRSTKSTGLLMAAAVTLIGTGVVLFVAIGHRPTPRSAPIPAGTIDIGAAPAPANVQDLVSGVPASGAARLQFADKNDPTRLQSELSFDKLDPAGNGYYTLEAPRAWIYMKDGRTLHIAAGNGRVKMPGKTKQPESGEFTGGVMVRLFTPLPDNPNRPVDPENDEPTLIAWTQSVTFDSVLLELATDDPLAISTPSLHFEGQGLLVRGNEVRERIEILRTSGKSIRFNPKASARARSANAARASIISAQTASLEAANPARLDPARLDPARPEPASMTSTSSPNTQTSGSEAESLAPPTLASIKAPGERETLYRAIFSDNVTVRQTRRQLDADTLEVWTRLIDNRLPENAFGSLFFSDDPLQRSQGSERDSKASTGAKSADTKSAQAAATGASNEKLIAVLPEPTPPAPPRSKLPSLFISGDDDVVMDWTGTLVLTPLNAENPPPQLAAGNHFSARFSAEKPGGLPYLKLTDPSTNARIACASAQYDATTRNLTLANGAGVDNIAITSPSVGRLVAPNLKANLGSGVAQVSGGGLLLSLKGVDAAQIEPEATPGEALPSPDAPLALKPEQTRQITWTDQADFQFQVKDSRLTSNLRFASFTGGVQARDRFSSIGGDYLRADFASMGRQSNAIKSLKLAGNVLAVSSTKTPEARRAGPTLDPFVSAQNLEISFAESSRDRDDVEPVFAVASGEARAGTTDAGVSAARIETRLGRDDKGNLGATDVVASGLVRFERRDGIVALADQIRADARSKNALLTGKPVTLARGSSRISGEKIRLDDAAGTLIVDGAGSFDHTQSTGITAPVANPTALVAASDEVTKVDVRWDKGMAFNNRTGLILCEGQSSVVATSPLSTQTLRSETLKLTLSPDDSSVPTTTSATAIKADTQTLDGRRLLNAEAIGSIVEREDGKNASVEWRRYSAAPNSPTTLASVAGNAATPIATGSPEAKPAPSTSPSVPASERARVLDQVFYVEGPRITADETTGLISVPAAGRAIVRDQRAGSNKPAQAPGTSTTPTDSRGTSGFTWAGSMEFNRPSGVLTMRKDVELVHVALDQSQKTRLVANELSATFATGAGRSQRSDMSKAEASGAVYAESGPSKLVADRFVYDAQAGTAQASANPGNRVTLYDDRKTAPLVARKLFWDLVNDRIEIAELAPIVAPR